MAIIRNLSLYDVIWIRGRGLKEGDGRHFVKVDIIEMIDGQ